jgi:antitoxin component of RelBE/YafQ-DinJ toxin-antitoxin module
VINEYKISGKTKPIEIQIEASLLQKLADMEKTMKLTPSEIINTALKRFISHHKDFFQPVDS